MTSLLTAPETRSPRVLDLAAHGSATAVRTDTESLTYAELAARVDDVARTLGPTRRLVLVEGANTVASLTAYLAAVTHGHVVLLAPPGHPARGLAQAWDPDVVIDDQELHVLRDGTAHDLHPDLALLLSTSGSTGSPKLVRLSERNLRANAHAIAEYLDLTPRDRAITSLPLHYCYGLSVVHSHLLVGATLVLTELSVVDECFWDLARETGATSFAGVPYTFELLERSGFAERDLPHLRYVTQAGGRLAPDQVMAWHARGQAAGWDLVVMYGQTEATARMAWLPPTLTAEHPGTVGLPIPGGSFRLAPVPGAEPGVGELIYSGANVMLGYAQTRADLGRGRDVVELRTGDLARQIGGVWEVVGRRGREAKLFGLRIDLDHLERRHPGVWCVADERRLHAFTLQARAADRLRAALAADSGLPTSAIRVTTLATLPRTESGKPDRATLLAHAAGLERPAGQANSLRDDVAIVLGRPDATEEDSFVDLGGDSLSYVELATRLSARLGHLPADWHTRPIGTLTATATPSRAGTRLDTSVVLRAVAIVAIVASHANVVTVMGGAHLLLGVAGWNFARFQLAAPTRTGRLRHGLAALVQVVVPASLWIGIVALLTGYYSLLPATYLNGFLGAEEWSADWQFWFLEALVWTTLAALALLCLPLVDRIERASPFGFALTLVLAAAAFRYAWSGLEAGPTNRYTIGLAAWFFLLGWLGSRARTGRQRALVVVVAIIGCAGFFGDPVREALVAGGIAALVLVPTVRVPRMAVGTISVLASSSLFVYLTHWQVYPHLEESAPLLATLLSFAVGIGYWLLARPGLRVLSRRLHAAGAPERGGDSMPTWLRRTPSRRS